MANSFLNDFFGFNKQQRNGLFILSLISLSLFLIRIIYPSFISSETIEVKNLTLIERKLDSSYYESQKYVQTNFSENKNESNLFVFDPNTVTFEQLVELGFKEKIAKTFLKFRDKGFVFKQKSDLQKVYGISDNFYDKLEPYILIENRVSNDQKDPINDQKNSPVVEIKKTVKNKIELNGADSLMLLEIDGIGPSFAKRILKYRSILGGFYNLEQLKEVYGFNDELFDKVKTWLFVEANTIKKIDLNKDDFKKINKHPYLSYELTKSIVDWRKKTVITATNLKDIINDDAVYKKLLPYVVFE
jgi:DNA uptake protein ComE-like DNA-binding protein